MFTVDDQAAGPHSKFQASLDHERLVLEARDVSFDWATLPFHYVPGEPFVTHVLNVLHLLLPAGEEFFIEAFKRALPLIKDDQLRLDVPRRARLRPAALRAFQPAAGGRRRSLRSGTRAVAASAQRSGESVGPRRHARSGSDDTALVPARLLRDVQGESPCGTG